MNKLQEEYFGLTCELLFHRELAGGELTQEQEGEYVDKFEVLWKQMTWEERDVVEKLVARIPDVPPIPMAPADLGLVDRVVHLGEAKMPREPTRG